MNEAPYIPEESAAVGAARAAVERYLRKFAPLLDQPYVVADRASLGCRRMDMRQHFLTVWFPEGAEASDAGLKSLARCLRSLAQFQPGIGEGFLDLVNDKLAPPIAARIRQAVDRDRLRFAMALPTGTADEGAPARSHAA